MLDPNGTLTLLYYAGYLTMTVCNFQAMTLSVLISVKGTGKFKIPNQEVMVDWVRWITAQSQWVEKDDPAMST
jgi:hypothetical protein